MRFKLDLDNIKLALNERLGDTSSKIPFDIDILFTKDYNSAMMQIYDILGKPTEIISWFDFSSTPEKYIEQLWIAREIILFLSLLEGTKQLPEYIVYANILGSTALLSDIDVSIESLVASRFIKIVEALWDIHPWFNHSLWKVDLYGDFVMIGDFYMNMGLLTNDIRHQLFELATASYFRHLHCDSFDHGLLHKLINLVIPDIHHVSEIISNGALIARTISKMSKKDQQRDYYELLAAAEHLHDEIAKTDVARDSTAAGADIIGRILVALARANLYREENYVIPSTIIHVVRIEQTDLTATAHSPNFDASCELLLTRIAKCSLDSRAYIMSAIEQLGYLQQSIADKRMITAGKYFGRFVRAIYALDDSYERMLNLDILRNALRLADDFAAEKHSRRRSSITNSHVAADKNLYDIAKSIFV